MDELDEAKLVTELDVPEQVDNREDPPRVTSRCYVSRPQSDSSESSSYVPKNGLVGPCRGEETCVMAIEECEVCVNFQDPVRLNKEDATNVDEVASSS